MATTQVIYIKIGGTRLSSPTEWENVNLAGPHSLCGRWDSLMI